MTLGQTTDNGVRGVRVRPRVLYVHTFALLTLGGEENREVSRGMMMFVFPGKDEVEYKRRISEYSTVRVF